MAKKEIREATCTLYPSPSPRADNIVKEVTASPLHGLSGGQSAHGQASTSKTSSNQFAPLQHIPADDGPLGQLGEAPNI